MKTIHFNTGRLYTEHGQRITATLHDDGIVTFHDHDRMIDGMFEMGGSQDLLTSKLVMHWYDHNKAFPHERSWKDAFAKNGCNAKYEGV